MKYTILAIIVIAILIGVVVLKADKNKNEEAKPSTVPAMVVEPNSPAIGEDGKLAQAIGLETLGGVFTVLLSQGTEVPCNISKTFSTAEDNQDQIDITLFRGTAKLTKDCHRLGKFQIVGILPAPRGNPLIEVTFAVQDNEVLLSAKDLVNNKAMQIKESKEP